MVLEEGYRSGAPAEVARIAAPDSNYPLAKVVASPGMGIVCHIPLRVVARRAAVNHGQFRTVGRSASR